MQPLTHCSSLMEVLPGEMKPLMSCDSDRSAVTRTKAALPLRERWFTSEETANEVHLLYSAIYFRKWRGGGCLAADKNPSEQSYQVASGHTLTQSHPLATDNKTVSAPFLNPITAWFKGSEGDWNYLHHISSSCLLRPATRPSSRLQGVRAPAANCDFKNNISNWEHIFSPPPEEDNESHSLKMTWHKERERDELLRHQLSQKHTFTDLSVKAPLVQVTYWCFSGSGVQRAGSNR